jgi:hypothetical protein
MHRASLVYHRGVGAIVDKVEEYRRLAAQCVHMAARNGDVQLKAIWIDMAGAWLKLADLAEKNSRADVVNETSPHSAPANVEIEVDEAIF